MTANTFAQTPAAESQAFGPTSDIKNIGDNFFWVGAMREKDGPAYALLRQSPTGVAEVLCPLGRGVLVRYGGGPRLCALGLFRGSYRTAKQEGKLSSVVVAGDDARMSTLSDNGAEFEKINGADSAERERLEGEGHSDLATAALGYFSDNGESVAVAPPVLAVRKTDDPQVSELLLFDSTGSPHNAKLDIPLAWDTPILYADPNTGDWLAYPLLSYDRRQDLKGKLPGIPICRVTRSFEISQFWVPWAEWNNSQNYAFFPLGADLIGSALHVAKESAEFSGLYHMESGNWRRLFASQVEPTSVAVAASNNYIAWSEQIKLDAYSPAYGWLRQILRVERV